MRISLLIDGSPLAVLASAMRGLPTDVKREISKHTRGPAGDMWRDELNQHVETRLQGAVARSGAVSVTARNVTLKAGGAGALSSGTAVTDITTATEFGMRADSKITTRSRKQKTYQRRAGTTFGGRRPRGNTVHPAARAVVPRMASLWAQTAWRTVRERIERL